MVVDIVQPWWSGWEVFFGVSFAFDCSIWVSLRILNILLIMKTFDKEWLTKNDALEIQPEKKPFKNFLEIVSLWI
jgi:hypothetical protein